MITRTYGPLHFTDLEPGRFEVLTLQIIYRMRRWEQLDHFGIAGSDDGIDINAVELLENGKRNRHHFQCKRYEKLSKKQLEKIVSSYMADNSQSADYYYLVCGCNPSKTAIDGFNKACEEAGIKHFTLWSASYLETLLYSDYHDILFGFFGINLTGERNNTISSIRRNLALKKRMHEDFVKKNISGKDLQAIRYEGKYWLKFKHSEVLIRSIYDRNYPENSIDFPGYYKVEIYDWYHNGLEVRAYPYVVDAKIKRLKEGADDGSNRPDDYDIVNCKLEVFGCISLENIIDYDIDGDEYYRYPHLYCDYPCGSNPYESIRYRTKSGCIMRTEDVVEIV